MINVIMDTKAAMKAIFGSYDKAATKIMFCGVDLTESSNIRNELTEQKVKKFVR